MLETGPVERFEKVGNYASYCSAVSSQWTSNSKSKGKGNKKNGSFAQKLGTNRLVNLLTATIDYWVLPTSDNFFIRFRYENGYEMATPNDKKHHFLISGAFKF